MITKKGFKYVSFDQETALLCYVVCFQSEMVGEGVYNCRWCSKPISFQRSLRFIIMRAQRPVALSVGPFGTLSMELFARVLKIIIIHRLSMPH